MNFKNYMRRLKQFFKRFSWYKELRYIYRSFVVYKKPLSYIYYRFFIGPKIRKLKHPIDRPPTDSSYSIHLLCSHNDLTMMLWSLASWYAVVYDSGQVYIHEDGSFNSKDRQLVAALLPNVKVINYDWATRQAADMWLSRIPRIREYRLDKRYFFTIKLVDPRFVSDSPARLLMDTDVLWFKRPDMILDFLRHRARPFFLSGRVPMDFKFADGSFPSKISNLNAGIIGYAKEHYDLKDLEQFAQLIGYRSNPYFIEQAGHAYILSRRYRIEKLPDQLYHIKGAVSESTVAKHYTGPRREQFWFEGVRILKNKLL